MSLRNVTWAQSLRDPRIYLGKTTTFHEWAARNMLPFRQNASKLEALENIGVAAARDPSVERGWEAGIRTPITASRAPCPTVERPPSIRPRKTRGQELAIVQTRSGPAQTNAARGRLK